MEIVNMFFEWDESVHMIPDQQKRLVSAKSSKTTPSNIDRDNMTGVFPGSGANPYRTTLISCTCGDFMRRRLPCKHIYRLAIELGIVNEKAETGVNKNTLKASQITLKDAVAELEKLTDDAQHIVEGFLYAVLYREDKELHVLEETAQQFLKCSLFVLRDSDENKFLLLKRNQIQEILEQNGITGLKRNMSKTNLIKWGLENVEGFEDMLPKTYTFTFVDTFVDARRRVYSYLLRKYAWDMYYDAEMNEIKYPHGAKFEDHQLITSLNCDDLKLEWKGDSDVCYFPNDEITELLTAYGHNRCLNGYVARPQNRLTQTSNQNPPQKE